MNISDKFLTALLGSAIALVQVQLAVALSSEEVAQIAKEITVMITGPNGKGSGVIIAQKDDTYYVLTAYHVFKQNGAYEIQTPDGERYKIFPGKQIEELDLALVLFSSKNSYQVARKSQSTELRLGATVYYGGYPFEGNQPRIYRFFEAKITGISRNSEKGYDLSYSGEPLQGMSGGPILDEQGRLIGIHGKAEIEDLGDVTGNRITEIVGTQGIPIEYYKRPIEIALRDFDSLPQLSPPNEPPASTTPDNNPPHQNSPIPEQPSLSSQATQPPQYPIPYKAINDLMQAQKADTSQPAFRNYFNTQRYFTGDVNFLKRKYYIELPPDYNFAIHTTTRAAYHYAIPKSPNQKAYVGATFLDPNATPDNPEMASIICEAIEPGKVRPADPVYRIDGSLICSRGTKEVMESN